MSEKPRAPRAPRCALRCVVVATLLATLAPVAETRAQDLVAADPPPAPAADLGPWSVTGALYLWLPEIQGSFSTRGRTADVNVDISDLFDLMGNGDLFAAGGHLEAGYERFTFFLDAFGGTARPSRAFTVGPRGGLSGTADLTMNFSFFEFGPAYRVLDWPQDGPGRPITVDALVGGRFMYFYQSITLQGSGGRFGRYANATSEWVDPFVGGRFTVPLVGELDLMFRGDIGGFGAGSELAWNLIGGFQYALPWQPWGARTSVVAVYKALSFDHEAGSGADAVTTALDLRGPALGLMVAF